MITGFLIFFTSLHTSNLMKNKINYTANYKKLIKHNKKEINYLNTQDLEFEVKVTQK